MSVRSYADTCIIGVSAGILYECPHPQVCGHVSAAAETRNMV